MTSAPASSEAFLETALPLAQNQQWDLLQARCQARLDDAGDDPVTLYLLGVAAFAANDLAKAAQAAGRALEAKDAFAECSDLVAIAHGLAGDMNTALYYAKLTVTLPPRPDLHAFHPASFPTFAQVLKNPEQDRLVNRAKTAMAGGQLALADNFLRQHLYFFPDDETAMLLVAVCLTTGEDPFGAVDWLRGALHRRPMSAAVVSALAGSLAHLGAFADARAVHERAARLAPDDLVVHARRIHDLLDDACASAHDIHALVRQWGIRFAAHPGDEIHEPEGLPSPLNVGVLLADLPGTPAGAFLAEVLSRANPAEFRLVGYGFGTLTDLDNIAFQHAVSEWYDITELDADTIGDMLRAEALDVVIDTAGFLAPRSLAALGGRTAPRQVLWRNAPFGTGLDAIDARLSDKVLDEAQGPAPEGRPLSLALGTTLAALPSADAPMLETAGREQVTFGADVSLRQLTPETAAWWAEALLAVPGSALLLRDNGLSQPKAVERLTAIFGNCGVAHRIDLVSAADAASFWGQVDVALMPALGAKAERGLDVLWGGLPLLAPLGPSRAGRELASLLAHAGLDELIARSPAELGAKAREWAADARRRTDFRDAIRGRLSAQPVFDAEARAQDLWQACRNLFQ